MELEGRTTEVIATALKIIPVNDRHALVCARFRATSEDVRNIRNTIMELPLTLQRISSAFAAAKTLVNLATRQETQVEELRNKRDVYDLSLACGKGATGRVMATGGSKAIEIRERTKTCQSRMIHHGLAAALLDIATSYHKVLMM